MDKSYYKELLAILYIIAGCELINIEYITAGKITLWLGILFLIIAVITSIKES